MCDVLVIEDEWLLAEHVADIARDAGATSIAMADSQNDAVRAADQRRPDIILSDVKLLTGTGPEAVRAIQQAHRAIPVIFITGTPEDCKPCGPTAVVLGKPIDASAVSKAFRSMAPL